MCISMDGLFWIIVVITNYFETYSVEYNYTSDTTFQAVILEIKTPIPIYCKNKTAMRRKRGLACTCVHF